MISPPRSRLRHGLLWIGVLLGTAVLSYSVGSTYAAYSDRAATGEQELTVGRLELVFQNSDGWRLNGTTAFDPQSDVIAPGAVLDSNSTFRVKSRGLNNVVFRATNPAWDQVNSDPRLKSYLRLRVGYYLNGDAIGDGSAPILVKDGDIIRAALEVEWPLPSTGGEFGGDLLGSQVSLQSIRVGVSSVGRAQ